MIRVQVAAFVVTAGSLVAVLAFPATGPSSQSKPPKPAATLAFEGHGATTRWDDQYVFVESDGLPDHRMMVGITAWQQQVPLPQPYTGDNAWQFPITAVQAEEQLSAKDHFFRGAIAIAVNGVPIFNPIKNDGHTDTFLAGELDEFGGHSGRADDYHYHLAPAFLNGGAPSKPVAYALDGYPIYGYAEIDGSPVRALDAFNGHEDPRFGYHYHATKTYPYLNGGFHGKVVEREGQVDPQPHAHPIRKATSPLQGARVTQFETSADGRTRTLTYELDGKEGHVRYAPLGDGRYEFVFTNPDGTTRRQIYPTEGAEPEHPAEPRKDPPRGDARRKGPPPDDAPRRPWIADHVREMDANQDGVLSLDELIAEVAQTYRGYDQDKDGRITTDERDAPGGVRSAMGGFVKQHWPEVDRDGDDRLTLEELSTTARSMLTRSDRNGDGRITADEVATPAEDGDRGRPRDGGREQGGARRGGGGPAGSFHAEVPAHAFDFVLGRPTRDSITVSIRCAADAEGLVEYRREDEASARRSEQRAFPAGKPVEVEIAGLQPDSAYTWRFLYGEPGHGELASEDGGSFRTARAPGGGFTFVVQADSHLDEGTATSIYARTLANEAADRPDFVVDLGDTFMVDKFRDDFHDARALYVAQRYWLGTVARSAPLFLVLGNHDGETRGRDGGRTDDMPRWSNGMRTEHFPCPAPNAFYSGNAHAEETNGKLRDYYAFEWGDALFVVLDPFLATDARGQRDDPWAWTLGAEQYAWLAKTLSTSRARHKFVFTHHLVGGNGSNARGGSEAARLFEWGGLDLDGTPVFEKHRPGFEAPIHDLLVRSGVSVVFHGHDHFFAKQDLDGIVYQLVPQPSHPGGNADSLAQEYGYENGIFLSSPGHIRVHVGPRTARVEFVRSDDGDENGKVEYAYEPGRSEISKPSTGSTDGGAAEPPRRAPRERDEPRSKRTRAEIRGPAADLSCISGRPTTEAVTLSVLAREGAQFSVEYGAEGSSARSRTPAVSCRAGAPLEIPVQGLRPDTGYTYRLLRHADGGGNPLSVAEGRFRTQRARGATFSFGVQGDSHPERAGKMFDAELYGRTLERAAAENLDFYVLLGDDFSIERLIERGTLSQQRVDEVYALQRGFLGLVGSRAALYLVNGNHEQAARYLLDGSADNAAVLAGRARTRYFPLPAPDGFYSGDAEEVEHIGLLGDYYSWEWGDALFVVIDPYWHSDVPVDTEAGRERGERGKGQRDLWEVTLGDVQYHWLEKTLQSSTARYKFVFSHHVLGTGRGGVEQAGLYEWGGHDRRGAKSFAEHRPGWSAPIHALFVRTGVTIFFQGHDHLFAHQELDGVVYQETPNPADASYTAFNRDAYESGDVLPNSGHLRVTVSPAEVRVDYLRSVLPGDEAEASAADGAVSFSYTVRPPASGAR